MEASRPDRPMTVEDLYRLPDDGYKYELEAGKLIREPLPGSRHGRVAIRIGALLDAHVRRRGLGVVIGNDSGYVLARSPDTVRGPDVSFVARQRYDRHPDESRAFPGAPDLAVEVLSPSNTPAGIHAKVADYLAAGTRLVWVIDAAGQTVTIYESLLAPRTLGQDERLDGGEVVQGFCAEVRELFER